MHFKPRFWISLLLLLLTPVAHSAAAAPTTIAFTSFEEPAAVGGQYTDTGDAAADHPLSNNAGEPLVNYTAAGSELGFSAFYFNTRNDVGLTDGDFVGVTSFTGAVGSYPDGTQGYQLQDADGMLQLTLDRVDLSGASSPRVRVQFFVESTGWESSDLLRIWATVDGGVEIDLINTSGSDIDDLGIEGAWLQASADLSGHTSATLRIALDSNAASESVYIDDVVFEAFVEEPIGACGDPATLVSGVQGAGDASPLAGTTVTVEGIVVADLQQPAELGGFFLQEESADFDTDSTTSEGVFVQAGATISDVVAGDVVRVTGTVVEADGLTQLQSVNRIQPCSSGQPLLPVSVALPETVDGELERYEGMLVAIEGTLTVAQNFFVGRYGQMTLSANGRLFQPTQLYRPDTPEAAAHADRVARNLLILDDGRDGEPCGDNPDPVPYLGAPPPQVIRAGDTVGDLVGVLDYGQINSGLDGPCFLPNTTFARDYRLHPVAPPVFTTANPRPPQPADVGGALTVAAFNVLNYFNGDGQGGGFPTSRGADTPAEFERQRAKIIAAIAALDADVLGLVEIENDGFGANSAIQDLVDGVNAEVGAGTYAFVDLGVPQVGSDEIAVAVIYKPAAVSVVGTAIEDDPAFTNPNDLSTPKNRAAVAVTFEDSLSSRPFTVVVNHLKSKGSACGAGDDHAEQGSCNDTRTKAALAQIDWLASDPTGVETDSVLIVGDLNAYAREDPLAAYAGGGYVDTVARLLGLDSYSFIFDGQSGTLDYVLASEPLLPHVTGVSVWHINTDEPPVIDYNTEFNPTGYYSADVYRASDHDVVILGLDFTIVATGVSQIGASASQMQLAWVIVAAASLTLLTAAAVSPASGGIFGRKAACRR